MHITEVQTSNHRRMKMKRISAVLITVFAIMVFSTTAAFPFPVGFGAFGGIGRGYYSMADLNSHIGNVGQDLGIVIDNVSNGINITLQGRVWFFNRISVTGGYQRLWAETEAESAETPLTYKAPCNVYMIGAAGTPFFIPNTFDINIGVNYCFARTTFGTNLDFGRRLREFKGNDTGYEILAEVVTNFIRPVEVGFQLGYRGLKVGELEDKYGRSPDEYYDYMGSTFQLDYSGFFFYLTAGIRL